jgi:hypothetical protein
MHVELARGELVAAADLAPHAELARFPLLPMLALGLAVLEPAADGDEVCAFATVFFSLLYSADKLVV